MKPITILSGKGGVGKSSIAASLAVVMSRSHRIACADCDVDTPNLSLVLGLKPGLSEKASTREEAVFDMEKCISCGRCKDECYFNAILWVKEKPRLAEYGCEGCGACEICCPKGAISMRKIDNVSFGAAKSHYGFSVFSARLNPGESGSGKAVSLVRKMASKEDKEFCVIDAPAGIGCPVIASIAGAKAAVVVIEPSQSSISDATRALSLCEHFRIPAAIIINKATINMGLAESISALAVSRKVKILASFPYDKAWALALAAQVPIIEYADRYEPAFASISRQLIELTGGRKNG